jgi:hypothetical protein
MYLDFLPSPAESPKSVFAHEHVTCAPGGERDAQDMSQGESRQERNMQDTPARALETRHPTLLGGTPSGRTAVMGCHRSAWPPLGPCARYRNEVDGNEEQEAKTREKIVDAK